MSEANSYYLLEEGQKLGPFTLEELFDRPVSPEDKVLSPLHRDWREAINLPELKYFFNSQGVYFPTQDNAASFSARFLAYVIDIIVIFIFAFILAIIAFGTGWLTTPMLESLEKGSYEFEIRMGSFLLYVLYNSIAESTKLTASFGKLALGLAVVDENGYPLTFSEALKRNLGKVVSGLIFGIGYLMILWTDRAQGLHDKLAHTFVINKRK